MSNISQYFSAQRVKVQLMIPGFSLIAVGCWIKKDSGLGSNPWNHAKYYCKKIEYQEWNITFP